VGGQGCDQFGVLGSDRLASAHDHQIQPQKALPLSAKALSHQTLEAVSFHRAAGALLGNGEPQTDLAVGVGSGQDGEVGIDGLAGAFEDPLELCLVEQPGGAGEPLVGWDLGRFFAKRPENVCADLLARFVPAGVPGTRVAGQRGVSRARPLARRACKTFRPLRVALRARKPWVLARLRRLG
jgi:hypothetical protein